MENQTIGDSLATAMKNLEHAIGTDEYHELDPHQQAYLQEALHYLESVQSDATRTRRSNVGVTTTGERR
ncbi:hypothetical protein SAMN04487948_104283 [Halogranum amylolyticum]|uniref:Uncharacterized protein n=1 Tax=Halogranum amylolyticum TaxID=660520 RepID=A0A1H8RWP7_9EURY|nr:hypothetical protein [Halogranum amylolyticum]SEO70716.1 hypothetical protein SAMN04487948_104283 [Halogranum amylolyticum]